MDTIPVASFLAGSLLSLLLPTLLLISIITWYHIEARRVPGPPQRGSRSLDATEATPASSSPTSTGRQPGQPGVDRPPGPSGESPPSGA